MVEDLLPFRDTVRDEAIPSSITSAAISQLIRIFGETLYKSLNLPTENLTE